jgi:BTB/POZ domain
MGEQEKFCLKWNDFERNISLAFKDLRDDRDFFDVTLACENSQIQAHKVILSACSPFFRGVLKQNAHQHPLLYLKGVRYQDLEAVLNFMYHGEVNVAQDQLNSFLLIAEELQVKGLTQSESGGSSKPQQAGAKAVPAALNRDLESSSGKGSSSPSVGSLKRTANSETVSASSRGDANSIRAAKLPKARSVFFVYFICTVPVSVPTAFEIFEAGFPLDECVR